MNTCSKALGYIVMFCLLACLTNAQTDYLQAQYNVRLEDNIIVGQAIDYQGLPFSVALDFYKPTGDDNCLRPLVLMIHGGAWFAGTRKDSDVTAVCQQLATRGYAVASLEYRLGHHKSNDYTPYAACPVDQCIYVSDSSEIIRAVYRGVQDARSALRFLASRTELDSTDGNNFFIGGISAGAFVALQTVIWNTTENRPMDAGIMPDAPVPNATLSSCNAPGASLKRPDLGDPAGHLHPDVSDPKINGVINFYGGVFDLEALQKVDLTAIYLYHQTNDLVVDCQSSPIMSPLYQYCADPFNLCPPNPYLPMAHGSCAIYEYLVQTGSNANILEDIDKNGPPTTLSCFANPPTHSIINIGARVQKIAGLFSPIIKANGNDPEKNCTISVAHEWRSKSPISVYPNPFNTVINIDNLPDDAIGLSFISMTGKSVFEVKITEKGPKTINVRPPIGVASGVYLLKIDTRSGVVTKKIVCHR